MTGEKIATDAAKNESKCLEMEQIEVVSSLDGSRQPSLFQMPETAKAVPLVVGLHTWSFNRFNQVPNYLPLCRAFGWALLLPEFRGPNLDDNPQCTDACGSRLARQDVLDAVRHVCGANPIDESNIFLLGCSGGGHMALLMAEEAPALFRAVDVWCPVSNLRKWHEHLVRAGLHYPRHIEACLGGLPDERPDEYESRSPSSYPEKLKGLPVSIHHGRHDPVVPFRHSAELARAIDQTGNDHLYLDIFDGGHEQIPSRSFEWFAKLAGIAKASVKITG